MYYVHLFSFSKGQFAEEVPKMTHSESMSHFPDQTKGDAESLMNGESLEREEDKRDG